MAEVEPLYILMGFQNASGMTMCFMVDMQRIRHGCIMPRLSFCLFYLYVIIDSYKAKSHRIVFVITDRLLTISCELT